MAAPCYREVVDNIDLSLFVNSILSLPKVPGADDKKRKKAIRGRKPGREQSSVGECCGSSEVVESIFATYAIVTVVRSHFIAGARAK